MPIVRSGTTDPYYKHRQLQNLGSSLGMLVSSIKEGRQAKRKREEEDIFRRMQWIKSDPRLADTMGKDLVQKHGEKYPWLEGAVGLFSGDAEFANKGKAAFEEWTNASQSVFEQQRGQLDQMPDLINSPMGLVQNPMKQQATMELEQQRSPLAQQVFDSMPIERQLAIQAYGKTVAGVPTPSVTFFDPQKLSAQGYDTLAASGMVPGQEFAYATQARQGTRPREGRMTETTHRAEESRKTKELGHSQAKERMGLSQENKLEAEEVRQKNRVSNIQLRDQLGDENRVDAHNLKKKGWSKEWQEQRFKDWKEGSAAARQETADPEEKATVAKEWNAKKPKRIPVSELRLLEEAANLYSEKTGIPREQALEIIYERGQQKKR